MSRPQNRLRTVIGERIDLSCFQSRMRVLAGAVSAKQQRTSMVSTAQAAALCAIEHDEVGLPPVVVRVGEQRCEGGHVHCLRISFHAGHECGFRQSTLQAHVMQCQLQLSQKRTRSQCCST